MREITGSEDVNIWGSCSGGITMSAFLAHLAVRDETKVHSATVAVCLLDMAVTQNTTAGLFVTPESIAAAKSASQLTGVVEGQELARMFAWMRPNDLIWNYWVNNYLLGNAPPAFDVLYWNNDTTRLPARLHADFLDLIDTNPFVNPARLKVRGAPPDPAGAGGPAAPVAGGDGPRTRRRTQTTCSPGAGRRGGNKAPRRPCSSTGAAPIPGCSSRFSRRSMDPRRSSSTCPVWAA